MSLTLATILFFVSIAILIRSGSVVVSRLSRIAHFLQLSEFAVAFAVIAFATSLPDLFVGLSAALHDKPELSFSNIVGANIITLTLAAGIAAIIARGLEIKGAIVRRDALYASFAAFLPVLLLLDGALSRVDGVILLSFLVWYFINLLYQRERFTKIFSNSSNNLFQFDRFMTDLVVLTIAILVLVGSSEGITRSAFVLAEGLGLSLPIIGILLVAMSITLPEIVFGVRAILMGHKEMVLGNLIGSVIINSGLVIGLTAIIAPMEVPSFQPYFAGILFTIFAALAFSLFTFTGKKISLPEGAGLVGLYIAFVVVTLVV